MNHDDLYQHCLRPLFTENSVRALQKKTSLNIYGNSGQGRGRLLEDIQAYQWDNNTKVLLINMKTCRESYASFLRALWQQSGKSGNAPSDLGRLLTTIKKDGHNIIILLHHFDALLDNPSIHQQFDVNFFNNLNGMRNDTQMALVCVTEKPHDNSVIFVGDKVHRNSWLDLEKKELVKLTFDEIKYEVKRRIDSLSGDDLQHIGQQIYNHAQPYELLKYFCDNLLNEADNDLSFVKRVKLWKKQYNQAHPIISTRNFNRWVVKMGSWARALGIRQLFDKILSILKAIYGDVFIAFFEWLTNRKNNRRKK